MNFKENLIKDLEENDVFLSLSPYQRMTIAEIADKQLRIAVVVKSFYCYDKTVANAEEDYDFKQCSKQCEKCKAI